MEKADYIIVGQGIAGSTLALTLHKKGKNVILIDEIPRVSCSLIAAGIYNPVVFKRLAKSWKADELIPFLEKFYTESELLLSEKLFFKKSIVKIFAEEQEITLWQKKATEPELRDYLEKYTAHSPIPENIEATMGVAYVTQAGHLNVARYVEATRNFFLKRKKFVHDQFDFGGLKISEEEVEYKNLLARNIVFCEGHKVLQNPFFNWLPFKLTKGELIVIEAPGLQLENIVNKGVYILPLGNHHYKIGATYEWKDLTEEPTEKGRSELLAKLDKLIRCEYRVLEHVAGIRPTVVDRRPILGRHPQHTNTWIFNGMGTKGVMAAPFMANALLEFIENGRVLDTEISIDRFLKQDSHL